MDCAILDILACHALNILDAFDYWMWGYIAVPAILLFGVYFSFQARWAQVIQFPQVWHIFLNFLRKREPHETRGINPLNAFFAAVGGCIGVGNVIGVCTAVQIGGPGAVFWMWVAALLGMIVKYSEIYLGMKYRVDAPGNTYAGGPMYYLRAVDKSGLLSKLFCIAMCIYGVEIYIFRTVAHTISLSWGWDYSLVVFALLAAVLIAGKGGIRAVGAISSALIPLFLCIFAAVCFWVFANNFGTLIETLGIIVRSAFTGHAAVGAFMGSSVILAATQGMKRACYAGDIGIGYASVIHAESEETVFEKQAAMGIFEIFLDAFVVCTLSVLLILVTGLWCQPIHENVIVAVALSHYIPYTTIFWPVFIFLLGYSTLIAFFTVGEKAAYFLWPQYGKQLYFWYAAIAFLVFSFVGTPTHVMTLMSSVGALLLLLNLYGIFKLRNQISFSLRSLKK